MNERLTIQDLTDLLAAKHSMTKKDAEVFVKEFFLLIEQALENEKTVKIKGLGTFKLIDVDSRESVNVNTGERFQIKGHTKVSFSPDANLRDTINKPFAHFETVVLNENTVLEDTPVEEVEEEEVGEGILASTIEDYNKKEESQENTSNPIVENESQIAEQDSSEEVDTVQEERITEQSIEEKVVVEESLMIEQQQPEQPVKEKERITAEQIIEQELLKANLKPEIPIVSPQSEITKPTKASVQTTVSPISKKEVVKKEKSPVPYLIAVIVIVLLLCGGVILFIYYPDLFSSSSDKNALDMPPVTTQPVQPEAQLSDTIAHKDTTKVITPDVSKVATTTQPVAKKEEAIPAPKNVVEPQSIVKKEETLTSAKAESRPVQQQPSASAYPDSASYKITGTKTKYTIKEGETLTRVSLRFYGTKAMWPYIVKHNPDVIKNPNNVPYGTTIKIPELTKE